MAMRCGFIYEPIIYLRAGTVNPRVLLFLGIVTKNVFLGKSVFG